jgi:hypothetical protein
MRKLFFRAVEIATISLIAFWFVKDAKNEGKGIKGSKGDPLDLKGFACFAGDILTKGLAQAVKDVR